ncbi:MAG TPA: hypothetical protein VKG38_03845, partial [Solirubrobacteraceae bacterium]|nr:hypothetical protein [Solirubrobacteraceae bacterium]
TLPVATIKPPVAVTKTSATLQATVNTNGLDASEYSECEFEYGETTAYGSSVPCTPASGSKAPTAISAAVTGLKAGTKYHYRAYFNYVAGGDPKARTRDEEFETAPNTAFKCAQGALFASGSGFQGAVQSVFREHYVATKADSLCEEPPPPTTTYTPTLSAAGLEAFGAGNAEDKFAEELLNRKDTTIKGLEERKEACGPEIVKAAAKGEASGKCLDLFIGTDDAPTPTQLANMTKAAGGKTGHLPAGGGTKENRGAVVVPVAQGPITVMLSLPAGCRIKGGNKVELSNVALGQIYEGENLPKIGSDPGGIEPQGGYGYATWGALLTQLGYAKVAKESGLGAASFYDAGTAEETLQRYSATNEKVKVHSKAQIEKGEGEETVELKNSKRETVKGEGCAAKIKPQVRATEAGTSYALKAYLNQIDSYVWKGFASEALSWPTPNVLQQNQSSSTKEALKQETDAQIAEATAATPGSVGYAEALDAVKAGATSGEAASTQRPYPSTDTIEEVLEEGEAENQKTKAKEKIRTRETVPVKSISHEILYAQLQNNGTQKPAKSSEFASPLLTADKANCETTKLVAGDQSYPLHWNGSWNGVLASDPDVAKVNAADYPLCAFSYAVAWHHYSNKALYGHETSKEEENAKKIAATVKDYFEYMTYTGPTDLTNSGFFTGPPAEMESHITVAVKNIGY